MRIAKALRNVITLATAASLLAGCAGLKNGSMAAVTPVTTSKERVGSVYLVRGWIGVFSTGIDTLRDKLDAAGVYAQVYQEAQWSALADTIIAKYESHPDHEPIILVGHSYGADDAILITRKLASKNIKVDLIVTLDPVTPRKVPANVARVYNLYQTGALDGLPFLRGIPLTPDSPGPADLENVNIRKDRTDLLDRNLDHFNIEKKDKIHADVIAQVLRACPTRSSWAASQMLGEPSRIDIALANRPQREASAAPQADVKVISTFATVVEPPHEVAAATPAR